MASPQSPTSGPHSPNEPATPKTPDVPQHSSLEGHSQNQSQISEPTPKANVPTFNRQISLPKTPSFYFDPYDPNTHTLEYASKVSGYDFTRAAEVTKEGDNVIPDTMRVSTEDTNTTEPTTETSSTNQPGFHSFHDSQTNGSINSDVAVIVPAEPEIKPPPRRLGKLTATAESFAPGLSLALDQSRTSWGRLPTNTIVYENSSDTRIPKTAFIIFWYSPIAAKGENVDDLSQQQKDWTNLESLHAGIFTLATSGITINGRHLKKNDEKGRALFGHLHSGDIIQVYHDPKGSECLRFKCEFYHGSAKDPRPTGESFHVQLGSRLPGT